MPMLFDAPQLSQDFQQAAPTEEPKLDEMLVQDVSSDTELTAVHTVKTAPVQVAPLPVKEIDYPEINDKAWNFCKMISRSNLIPESIRSTVEHDHTPEVYMVMSMGRELGFTFMQTLAALYILPGSTQPALYTKAKRALVLRAGGVFEKEVWDDKLHRAIVTINRNGQRITRSFGEDEALSMRKAYRTPDGVVHGAVTARGLPTPWAQDFKGMCLTRAVSRACDAAYPDVLMALPSVEELKDTQSYEAPAQTVVESNAELPKAEINPAIATAVKPRKKRASASTTEELTQTPEAQEQNSLPY